MSSLTPKNVIIQDPFTGDFSQIRDNRALTVDIRENTYQPFDLHFVEKGTDTTVAVNTVLDTYTVTVTNGAVFTIGDLIGLIDDTHASITTVLGIAGNLITVSDPWEGIFVIGTLARPWDQHMNVDGSIVRKEFSIREAGETDVYPYILDVTRIMLQITSTAASEFTDFGDIAGGLTKGIVLRKVDGAYVNYWNARTNADLALLAYDVTFYDAANPSGVYGLAMRYTFNDQDKHNVVVRLFPGDTLEVLIQDDLSSLVSFKMMAQGYVFVE